MIAKNLISDIITPVKPGETAIQALSWMDEFRVSHLAVVDENKYLGLISEEEIYVNNRFEEAIGVQPSPGLSTYVNENQHVFDVLRAFSEHKLSLLPVLDDANQYMGVISLGDLIHRFSSIASLQNPGSVIVIERSYKDYSLAEITQIIESNDAAILSLFITSSPDSAQLEISIKINRMELGPILQTFNRYNYTIKATYGESSHLDDLKDRYDQLMAYLNI